MTQQNNMHFRAPVDRDTRVALCTKKWCSWNTTDWAEVTCPECQALGAKEVQRQERATLLPSQYAQFDAPNGGA